LFRRLTNTQPILGDLSGGFEDLLEVYSSQRVPVGAISLRCSSQQRVSGAALGLARKNPCARSQPNRLRRSWTRADSTPSPTTDRPRLWPRATAHLTIATAPQAKSMTNER